MHVFDYLLSYCLYSVAYTLCLKNEPTLASCSFVKHGLILIILGTQHKHTFRNYMHIQLSLSIHFYLYYLLLHCCDGNDATPATWSSVSMTVTHGDAYHKTSSTKLLVNEKSLKAVVCMHEGWTSLWTSTKIKPALFTDSLTHSLLRLTSWGS